MEILLQSEIFMGILLILTVLLLVGGVIVIALVLPLIINIYKISKNVKKLSHRVSEEGINVLDDVQMFREKTSGFMARQGPRMFEFFLKGLYAMFTREKEQKTTSRRRTRKKREE